MLIFTYLFTWINNSRKVGLWNCIIINVPISFNYGRICTIIHKFYKSKAKFVIETMKIIEKIQAVLNLWKGYRTRYIFRFFSSQFIGWIFAQSGCTNKYMKTHSLQGIMVFVGMGMRQDEWEEDRGKMFLHFCWYSIDRSQNVDDKFNCLSTWTYFLTFACFLMWFFCFPMESLKLPFL